MRIKNLSFSFEQKPVFNDFSLEISEGKITALMAPSGMGKTTLLRLIAGLLKPQSGCIDTDGKLVGIMFQEPRLFGQLTVLQNVMLVVKDKTRKHELAMQLLEDFGVSDAAEKYPDELSGGMAKRVSLARAIAYDPDILLLDEPFSALDQDTKKSVMCKTRALIGHKTVLFVTHDEKEARDFADEIVILP